MTEEIRYGNRRTGRTTRALINAPRDATYVAPSHHAVGYIENLARSLGRDDIRVISKGVISTGGGLRGHSRLVEIDHATFLDFEVEQDVRYHNERVRVRNTPRDIL